MKEIMCLGLCLTREHGWERSASHGTVRQEILEKMFNTQHCTLSKFKKWQKSLYGGCLAGAPLTDLSKVFDNINHELLIAKLKVHGADTGPLEFLCSYLTKAKYRKK